MNQNQKGTEININSAVGSCSTNSSTHSKNNLQQVASKEEEEEKRPLQLLQLNQLESDKFKT